MSYKDKDMLTKFDMFIAKYLDVHNGFNCKVCGKYFEDCEPIVIETHFKENHEDKFREFKKKKEDGGKKWKIEV